MKKQIHFFMRCEEANVNSSVSMMKINILNYINKYTIFLESFGVSKTKNNIPKHKSTILS